MHNKHISNLFYIPPYFGGFFFERELYYKIVEESIDILEYLRIILRKTKKTFDFFEIYDKIILWWKTII